MASVALTQHISVLIFHLSLTYQLLVTVILLIPYQYYERLLSAKNKLLSYFEDCLIIILMICESNVSSFNQTAVLQNTYQKQQLKNG
jgi:hypothetical protein